MYSFLLAIYKIPRVLARLAHDPTSFLYKVPVSKNPMLDGISPDS